MKDFKVASLIKEEKSREYDFKRRWLEKRKHRQRGLVGLTNCESSSTSLVHGPSLRFAPRHVHRVVQSLPSYDTTSTWFIPFQLVFSIVKEKGKCCFTGTQGFSWAKKILIHVNELNFNKCKDHWPHTHGRLSMAICLLPSAYCPLSKVVRPRPSAG